MKFKINPVPPEQAPPVHVDVPPKKIDEIEEKLNAVALPATQTVQSTRLPNPSQVVHAFLVTHNIVPKVVAVEGLNVWVGDGYLLNDKPLLKVVYEYGA